MSTMLSFVLENKPVEWEDVNEYTESYKIFDLHPESNEFLEVENMFKPTSLIVNTVQRIQNPFQYGRFKLRQEMVGAMSMETVYHIIHESNFEIALKYTCDYRRYKNDNTCSCNSNKQPIFYHINDEIFNSIKGNKDKKILVVNKLPGNTQTQSDYYIKYAVGFK